MKFNTCSPATTALVLIIEASDSSRQFQGQPLHHEEFGSRLSPCGSHVYGSHIVNKSNVMRQRKSEKGLAF